ncbi:MarR family transcriptional regulator [Christensenellaceae bacterium OttesenSCG-928-L17]|nr:MarR family transcriptional regulator [Christensenellaceae bacterium OttesenSCG-928-L17]
MEQKQGKYATREALEEYLRLTQVLDFCMAHTLQKYGLYDGQPAILFQLQALGTPTQSDLAAALCVSKASVGMSLRRMEKAGFVRRVQDKKDTRCNRVSLTPRGVEFVRWCEIDMNMLAENLLEDFDAEECEQVIHMLQRMKKGMEGMRQRILS